MECGYRIHEQTCYVCNHPATDVMCCFNTHTFPGFCPLQDGMTKEQFKAQQKPNITHVRQGLRDANELYDEEL